MDCVYVLAKRWIWCTLPFVMAVLLVGEARTSFGPDPHAFAESAQGEPLAEMVVAEEEEEPGDDDEATLWALTRPHASPPRFSASNSRESTQRDEAHVGGIFRPPRLS